MPRENPSTPSPLPAPKRRPWMLVLGIILVVGSILVAWLSIARSQQSQSPEDEFKVFEADLGPAWIDVSAYPPEQQQSYALFSRKCSKCHTLARPINSSLKGDEWVTYVNRMSRKAGSGISPGDAQTIQAFLIFDSERRARSAGAVDPKLLPFLEVSKELTGVKRFPASKRDIRSEDGMLRVNVEADPRLDLSTFFAADDGQKLVKWTRRSAYRGELVLTEAAALQGKAGEAKAGASAALTAALDDAIGDETDSHEKVEMLLDWLDESIERAYRKGDANADAVLADRRGDATEFTRLFVALANAAGIPARVRVGFVAQRTAFYFQPWAEVWIDGWIPVDAYLGQFPADLTHVRVASEGADALAGWDVSRVPAIDRLQLRIISEAEPAKEGS